MKSVNKGTKLNERFRSSDTVEKASLDEIIFNFLYEDETVWPFYATSVLSILQLTCFGSSIDIGFSS